MSRDLTVLLVDDEPEIRRALRRDIGPLDLSVIEASSSMSALVRLESCPVAAVVCDYQMEEGGMSGLRLLERVRAQHPRVVRVLLTGHTDLHLALEALNRGVVHRFLTKPWDARGLRTALRQTIDRAGQGGAPREARLAWA